MKKKSTTLLQIIGNWKKKAALPINIRWVSISLFLFMMGRWLGWDTFFSVYVKSILGSGFGLMFIGTLLAVIKLFLVIPVGVMNDQWNARYLLLAGKLVYIFSGLFYFLAGMHSSPLLLVLAVVLNGIASSMMFTTYRVLYGKGTQHSNRSRIFGFYFSSINLAYVIWALLSAFLVSYLELPYMYLFIIIFALLSLLQDGKIQDFIKKKFSKSWKKWNFLVNSVDTDVDVDLCNIRKLFGTRGVIVRFSKEAVSFASWKRMFATLKSYGRSMYTALSAQALVSFMNYVGFLFIPIIANDNNLSLSEIAILFAVMRLPYVINVLIGGFWDKYSKKILITILVFIGALLYILLWFYHNFWAIIVLSFWISLVIAMLSPVTSALVIGYARPKDRWLMSGLQEFASRIGEIIGSLVFGMIVAKIGMDDSFIVLGGALAVLSMYLLVKKLMRIKTKDGEAKKEVEAQQPLPFLQNT